VAAQFFLLLTACTDRKYSNPLDPRNPDTRGRPVGLRAYSVRDTVFLRWPELTLAGLRAVRVWRAEEGAGFQLLAELQAGADRFADAGLRYGIRYRYYLTVVGEDFETPPSDTMVLIPGPTSILVADTYAGRILRLSHDGRHVIWESSYAAYPYDVAVDRRRNRVWVPDALDASVLCLSLRYGDFLLRARGFWRPWRLSVEPSSGAVLVADWFGAQVVKLDREGSQLWQDGRAKQPVDVASSVTGGYWVLDRREKTLLHYPGPSGDPTRACPFDLRDPREIDVDGKGMNLWVADTGAVYYFDYRSSSWRVVLDGLTNVRALDCEPTGERCWILEGATGSSLASRALRVHRDGNVEVESRGWSNCTDIAWDWYTSGCALVDPVNHELIKLDGNGRVVSRYSDLIRPMYVEIE